MSSKEQEFEKVPLYLIYKKGTQWLTEVSDDVNDWELLGFLTTVTEDLRQKMVEDLRPRTDSEREL